MAARVEDVLGKLGIKYNPKPKSGWLWGFCPYHEDHDPSWRIRITDERYGQHVCYSCKNGGGLADLVIHCVGIKSGPMENEDDVRKKAYAWLKECEQNPTPVEEMPEVLGVRAREPDSLVREDAASTFILPREIILEPFDTWVTPARRYAEARGITFEQVERYGIGYAVMGRLEGRIALVTWKAHRDLMIAQSYQARDFTGAREKRYLYPGANECANLDTMFGEHLWPRVAAGREQVIVTEGALNALAVERAVGGHVAALGGSFIRPAHTLKLATFREVVLLTDSDKAGDEAATQLTFALCRHVRVTRARLPDKVDANDIPTSELCTRLGAFIRDSTPRRVGS